ncbi:hypothetical protein R77592_02017 [Ralstonia mannitolilytica]|nr:hypothetical protein R77592_02017 [Ralstonia mannitolilytica]
MLEQHQSRLFTSQEAAAYMGVQSNTLATWDCTQRKLHGALAYEGGHHDQ